LKYLILDIDGVMNTTITARTFWKRDCTFDTEPTRLLRQILYATDAHVVISAACRKLMTLREFRKVFQKNGLPGNRIVGYTPESGINDSRNKRGLEIQEWIDDHAPAGSVIAILDDADDMAHLMHRLVQTDGDIGLTASDAKRIIALLNE
jgi:hypothetical protein